MFNGSEHFNQDYFKVLEKLGATDLNGTTNEDRTNYFQNVPTAALDTVLWMESDRMGHLLGVIDQPRLDEQRGVVQNEKRQGENEPYGLVEEVVQQAVFPASHPYSWTVIGSMEDLSAATLKDVKEWFGKYYGTANATIVLAGDIDAKTAKEKVEKYFGHIAAGPPVARHREWIAKRTRSQRAVLDDRVPQARIYKVWNVPPDQGLTADRLRLAAMILGGGKTSRLYKRLVYDDQIATDAYAFIDGREIASLFYIVATARPGGDIAAVEKAVDEELKRFLAEGPTAEELARTKTRYTANLVRGLERVGGFGGKSDLLARWQVYTGDPGNYKKSLTNVQTAAVEDVKKAAGEWLSDGVFTLEVRPFAKHKVLTSTVDRSKVPEPSKSADPPFPALQRATLSNGLKIILAERRDLPLVQMGLVVDAGFASDRSSVPGLATLALNMMDEGTKTRKSLEISAELEKLGANLQTGSNLDTSFVILSALKPNLKPSLDLYADVILNPSFPESDFNRERKQQIARIKQEGVEPFSMGLRLLPVLIYGSDHAYGMPFTGSGTEASVNSITRDALVKFHSDWFKPNNSTLVVVGDTTMAEVKPMLESVFANWKPGEAPKKNIAQVAYKDKPTMYLVDRPGSIQSVILAGHLSPPKSDPDRIAIETLNRLLGGAFVSRLNMNLREDKHWAYGAGSAAVNARAQGPFIVFAPVQSDKTKESIAEVNKELRQIVKDKPASAEELSTSQEAQTLRLGGSRETQRQLLNAIMGLVEFNLPDDYYNKFPAKVRSLTLKDMNTAAEKLVRPDSLIWVVVGDRSKIESGIRELGIADVKLIDAEGNPVAAGGAQ
jgi:zinc protease